MINSVETTDAGNYTCYVSNMAATKSVQVALSVAGARPPALSASSLHHWAASNPNDVEFRTIATDDPVAWCVCQSVTRWRPVKTAERIEIHFAVKTFVLDGGADA